MREEIDKLVVWLRKKVKDAHAKGLVFGLSGGIDSAVIAGLSILAFPESTLALIMPCHSHPQDEEDGLLLVDALGLTYKKIDLTATYESLLNVIGRDGESKLAYANIKPRLRMTSLYYHAQKENYLVAGGTNKSELMTGYFTKHADSGVDLLPIGDFLKKEVFQMAEYLSIPKKIIEKSPSAGLWTDQTDEEEMGFSYDLLDKYLETGQGQGEIYSKIDRMIDGSLHKREYPPIYKNTLKER